jgi:hypothetical protein
MKNEEQNSVAVGRPWSTSGQFPTYAQAKAKADQLSKDEKYKDHQIKIRRMNDPASFAIKLRLHPDVVKSVESQKKKKRKTTKKK